MNGSLPVHLAHVNGRGFVDGAALTRRCGDTLSEGRGFVLALLSSPSAEVGALWARLGVRVGLAY